MSLFDDSDELHGIENMFDWDDDGKLNDFERFMMDEELMGEDWKQSKSKPYHAKPTVNSCPKPKTELSRKERNNIVAVTCALVLFLLILSVFCR